MTTHIKVRRDDPRWSQVGRAECVRLLRKAASLARKPETRDELTSIADAFERHGSGQRITAVAPELQWVCQSAHADALEAIGGAVGEDTAIWLRAVARCLDTGVGLGAEVTQ